MSESLEFIRLADHGGDGVVVRVLGRSMPGVLWAHDYLDAEIIVTSEFVNGRLETCLLPEDLNRWGAAVEALASGRDVSWMGDRAPELRIEWDQEASFAAVTVRDPAASGVSVTVPLHMPDGWIDHLREGLERIRQTWPGEVEETSPGVYVWRERDHIGQVNPALMVVEWPPHPSSPRSSGAITSVTAPPEFAGPPAPRPPSGRCPGR